jgi:gamma-glutamyltranspeptidase/glutathione hydrolase
LASEGFIVSPAGRHRQPRAPGAGRGCAAYFRNADGTMMKAGDRLINKPYAATLSGRQGSAALLTGPIAEDILKRLHQGPYPSPMTLADMAAYKPRKTEALCRPYRAYVVHATGARGRHGRARSAGHSGTYRHCQAQRGR